jgi:hypothetical protein
VLATGVTLSAKGNLEKENIVCGFIQMNKDTYFGMVENQNIMQFV